MSGLSFPQWWKRIGTRLSIDQNQTRHLLQWNQSHCSSTWGIPAVQSSGNIHQEQPQGFFPMVRVYCRATLSAFTISTHRPPSPAVMSTCSTFPVNVHVPYLGRFSWHWPLHRQMPNWVILMSLCYYPRVPGWSSLPHDVPFRECSCVSLATFTAFPLDDSIICASFSTFSDIKTICIFRAYVSRAWSKLNCDLKKPYFARNLLNETIAPFFPLQKYLPEI